MAERYCIGISYESGSSGHDASEQHKWTQLVTNWVNTIRAAAAQESSVENNMGRRGKNTSGSSS